MLKVVEVSVWGAVKPEGVVQEGDEGAERGCGPMEMEGNRQGTAGRACPRVGEGGMSIVEGEERPKVASGTKQPG